MAVLMSPDDMAAPSSPKMFTPRAFRLRPDIHTSMEYTHSKRTKHVSTKYNYVKDLSDTGITSYIYCPTDTMIADVLTKPLERVKLEFLRKEGGLKDIVVEEEC
jgi:hypothetical protein